MAEQASSGQALSDNAREEDWSMSEGRHVFFDGVGGRSSRRALELCRRRCRCGWEEREEMDAAEFGVFE